MNTIEHELSTWGWDDGWSQSLTVGELQRVGRVVQDGRLLRVSTAAGMLLANPPHAKLAPGAREETPVCGDWVIVERFAGTIGKGPSGVIRRVLPRRNSMGRCTGSEQRFRAAVTNVDEVWIVCGLDRDPKLRNLFRYQALTRASGAEVVIVLNKIDQVSDLIEIESTAHASATGLAIVSISALSQDRLVPLESRLVCGRTVALLGASGAGKSTLLNRLSGANRVSTGEVRESDARGRHTTTSSTLVRTRTGGLIVDTPGSRELGIFACERGITATFPEIDELANDCRFRDCQHDREPGCAVHAALQDGRLSAERFLKFLELRKETERLRPRKGRV